MESVFIVTGIVAVTELAKRLNARDWIGAATIVAAVVIGVVGGLLHIDGLTLATGIKYALAAVGTHQLAQQVG